MSITIIDEFSHISNRNMRLYFRRKRDGLCVHCGGKPEKGHIRCKKWRLQKEAHYKRTYKPKKRSHKYTPRPSKYLCP